MKLLFIIKILCMLSIWSAILTATDQISLQQLPTVIVREGTPNQVQALPPDVRDQLMLAHGLSVLASFGKILLDPHNIPSVKENAAHMLDGVTGFLLTAMRCIALLAEDGDKKELMQNDKLKSTNLA